MQGKRNIQTKTSVNAKNDGGAAQQKPVNKGEMPNQSETSSTKNTQSTFLQGCLGCFGIVILIGIVVVVAIAMFGEEDKPGSEKPVIQTEIAGEDSASIEEEVRSRITKAVGQETNMGEPKIISLQVNDHAGTLKDGDQIVVATLHGNDNLSNKLMKGGMQLESIKVFRALFEIPDIEDVTLIWQFPTTDSGGNSSLNTVLKITVTKATADGINWSEFDKDNFAKAADSYWEHPELRE